MTLQDSGNRTKFDSGAVRDMQKGKGRCDLLPLYEIDRFLDDSAHVCNYMSKFLNYFTNGRKEAAIGAIEDAIEQFLLVHCPSWDEPTAVIELSKLYEEGAEKYDARNWEKGMQLHCFVNSGIRHYLKFLRGDKDENHDRAFLWNMFGLIWTIRNRLAVENVDDLSNIYN